MSVESTPHWAWQQRCVLRPTVMLNYLTVLLQGWIECWMPLRVVLLPELQESQKRDARGLWTETTHIQ